METLRIDPSQTVTVTEGGNYTRWRLGGHRDVSGMAVEIRCNGHPLLRVSGDRGPTGRLVGFSLAEGDRLSLVPDVDTDPTGWLKLFPDDAAPEADEGEDEAEESDAGETSVDEDVS
jgi:hypothetical protein